MLAFEIYYSYSILEIRTALMTTQSNSAPGSDGVPTPILQLCEMEEDVLSLFNSHSTFGYNSNTVPDTIMHGIIVSIS